MVRTDIHRPSAPEFDPEGYQCVGCFDLRPEWPDTYSGPARIECVNRQLAQGYKFTSVHGVGQCGHCGASIRYAALMVHPQSKGMIWIGETCLVNRFDLTQSEFKHLRENAKLNRERKAKSEKIAAVLESMPANLRDAYDWATTDECAHYLAQDIARKVTRYASELSCKQEELLVKLHGEHITREAQKAVRAQEIASGTIQSVPAGRTEVHGTILSVKLVENFYGATLKMLVEDDRGFRVFGTVPSGLKYTDERLKGSSVAFTATLEPKADDPTFGFFSRPTKAHIMEAA